MIKIIQHETPKMILQMYFLGFPLEEMESVGGYDADGKDIGVITPEEMLSAVQETGCWAFTNVNTEEVHVWVNKAVDMSLLISMLAHEKAHLLPKKRDYPEEIEDEMIAEEYAQVAVWAYDKAVALKSSHNKAFASERGR